LKYFAYRLVSTVSELCYKQHILRWLRLESIYLLAEHLCQICLFELTRVEGGREVHETFKWGTSYKSLGTSGIVVKLALATH
jgi:hypothetical protein